MYPPVVNGERKPQKICVPDSLHEKAFRICHAHPLSGHLGLNKTRGMLAERFYWPNLYTFAKVRKLNCVPCQCKRLDDIRQGVSMHDMLASLKSV